MQASETSFQPVIEGTKQYVVPLFQRSYSWTNKDWQVLWDDLIYLCNNEEPKTAKLRNNKRSDGAFLLS